MLDKNKKYHLNWIYVGSISEGGTKIKWESFDTWGDLIKKKRSISNNFRVGGVKSYKSRKW